MFQGTFDLETATPVEASAMSDVLFERGLYWASGRSGVVNLVAAHKWFNLAALKGRKDAIRCAGNRRADVGCRDRGRAARSAGLDLRPLSRNHAGPVFSRLSLVALSQMLRRTAIRSGTA